MAKKFISWKTKGMNRDMSVSAFNPEFAFENLNIRLSTNDGNTMMSWVNERGTKELKIRIDTTPWETENEKKPYNDSLSGTPIGTAILNHKLVIFSHDAEGADNYDYITVLEADATKKADYKGRQLYRGHLNFDLEHPIETLISFESEQIQKVYWTDNKNQPRVINISSAVDTKAKNYTDRSFDFIQELDLNEEIYVDKILGTGEFPSGVIQYAFTYYNKYGQESNIFHTTPLQYISFIDRGGSPEEKIANAFKITIKGADTHFDYVRIYSILRTSRDATPFVKRIQDIGITGEDLTFIDDGRSGDSIDPTELLYKGGEEMKVKTMEQKDGTLFLGNISVTRPPLTIKDELKTISIKSMLDSRAYALTSKAPFNYINTLYCPETVVGGEGGESTTEHFKGAVGFKGGEYYRLGVQFQYKNGKWSEPCWIKDAQQKNYPKCDEDTLYGTSLRTIQVPGFKCTLPNNMVKALLDTDYKRVRPVMVLPKPSDRTILCQGVCCPTLYRKISRYSNAETAKDTESLEEGTLYAQSSWLFRTQTEIKTSSYGDASNGGGKVSYEGQLKSQYEEDHITEKDDNTTIMSPYLRNTEVMGIYDENHSFCIDSNFITIHSPEALFDDYFTTIDYEGCFLQQVGQVPLKQTYGDIDIQTSTPAIGSDSAGFVHRSIVTDGAAALISGPFYNDYVVDDPKEGGYAAYHTQSPAVDFPVYMWHKNGSLNNDVARENRSAVLLKKRISNYRLGGTTIFGKIDRSIKASIQLFSNDELAIIKVDGHPYMGNIETMVVPTTPSNYYFIGDPTRKEVDTDFFSDSYYFLALQDPKNTSSTPGIWKWTEAFKGWVCQTSDIGDRIKGLDQWREGISIKYKSTPHFVANITSNLTVKEDNLPLVEICRGYDKNTLYGGQSDEALKAATWIPCGPIAVLQQDKACEVEFKWGDTYFQRYECLKTYPFTPEDKNQVIEIASFVCETRVNIDGRYDRNRAQTSNLNMSPINFNLLNPIYSQMDNFFSYKMLDDEEYNNVKYPNTITWTKTKENGADIDLWTNVTLANTLELDGDKGVVNKLIRMNDQLLSFQDSGISQILYNENTQISTTEGLPIELANSNKVQGKRYYTDTVGCSNKWSVVQTPLGIYFMDSNEKSIYLFNGQLHNLSTAGGMNSWVKQHIPSAGIEWTPESFNNFVVYYDRINLEVLFINKDTALAYSEKFNCFTSFYDYGNSPYYRILDDVGLWLKDGELWQHQAGEYCRFFEEDKPFSMTLIGNQEPHLGKMFTNLEFRSCVEGEGISTEKTFTPYLPFDYIEVWDEYQHGIAQLATLTKHDAMVHHQGDSASLKRKFRAWRCDIPRDNAPLDEVEEGKKGIKRFKVRPMDRIRNPWAYIKLQKKEASLTEVLHKTEVHDILVTYFD